MRMILGLSALSALALSLAVPAASQPRYDRSFPLPPGPYQSQCSNIRVEGQFLKAWCRGTRGSGESSINIESCSTPIMVDPSGGLICTGPGGGAPPAMPNGAPRDYPREAPYDRGYDGRYGNDGRYGYGERPNGRAMATVYEGTGYRGRPLRLYGPIQDLHRSGLNDRVRSIRIERRSGPWLVCTEANYGGRCVTIDRSTPDTRMFGMSESISSLRPAW
ncbi:beta/gamma crystallin-related protein [Phenylobacterium soli]|uniref:Beta/gamma crystallin 'Greek key' domain-containing protein n=1 Tax=Phenylobacterium soli TaxID=2170551 RepID=A0A328API6_9CAUL|nr:beta/gamma crystallin-related protein [Phenylobacterium soli]RAK54758.1 hypothetical protein DJ017_09580 [Phenylobacterium soli]